MSEIPKWYLQRCAKSQSKRYELNAITSKSCPKEQCSAYSLKTARYVIAIQTKTRRHVP